MDDLLRHIEHVEKNLLEEIRENRKVAQGIESKLGMLHERVFNLDKEVMSNKIKLSIFITGISLGTNILFILIAEKVKSFFT